jgi:hypothetical protein
MTNTLNPSLALIVRTSNGKPDAICFVADLDQPLEPQASDYLLYENLDPGTIVDVFWHNALDDKYGNRYEPKIEQVG